MKDYETWSKKHRMLNRMLRWLLAADVDMNEYRKELTPEDVAKLRIYYTGVLTVLGLMLVGLILSAVV